MSRRDRITKCAHVRKSCMIKSGNNSEHFKLTLLYVIAKYLYTEEIWRKYRVNLCYVKPSVVVFLIFWSPSKANLLREFAFSVLFFYASVEHTVKMGPGPKGSPCKPLKMSACKSATN